MKRRKAMSIEQGRELVERWRQSGLSQTAFAKQEQLDQSRISFWIRKVGKLNEGKKRAPAAPRFVRVEPRREEVVAAGTLEVVMRGGLYVRIGGEVAEGLLRRVLAAAAELAC